MKVENCRLCGVGRLSEPKLVFPPTPLANEFLSNPCPQELFPLEVCVCNSCEHYQLNESIDPARLFTTYSYAAGHSAANIEHFEQAASQHVEKFSLTAGMKVLDIASNDGTLLDAFKKHGMTILGIDPAQNLASDANSRGIPTLIDFFSLSKALELKRSHGQFDLVTANNVFAHVPDLQDFAKGVKTVLAPEGVFSFEVSYFLDVCEKTLFDTIYHEHSSYHTLTPLISFFNTLGMKVFDVDHLPNHGGSVRVYVCNAYAEIGMVEGSSGLLASLLKREKNITEEVVFLKDRISQLGDRLNSELKKFKCDNKTIAIFGVPAKATTLMYAFGLTGSIIDFAIDGSPLKQGMYTPGTHLQILPPSAIAERKPEVLLILAWNFADTIIQRHAEFKGDWIIPLPELKIINS
jgi:SAM-dependent methyltransferase|tara:strand:+ start:586723 stop:587943 length:1221 start_codon:yes stop_codon:yes gene_type:complete